MAKITEQAYDFYATANTVLSIDFPSQTLLKKIALVRVGTGAITLDLYSRAFATTAQAVLIRALTAVEATELASVYKIIGTDIEDLVIADTQQVATNPWATPLLARVGDEVTVAGTSNYNATSRVAWHNKELTKFLLEDAYVTNDETGTIKLDIQAANQPLWQVIPQQTGTDKLLYFVEAASGSVPYHNMDVRNPRMDTGALRKLYLKLGATAHYKMVTGTLEDVG